ncbi:CRTAC1 family protein [Aquisphaera insulae]|uniref:CRTAC1 family protein n=1 Tax=Aquisphaera insulae TaxID=2712864 RepID=UPI0013EBC9A9|nr:CRTAC1 family protein [Aquisphaera insulae]
MKRNPCDIRNLIILAALAGPLVPARGDEPPVPTFTDVTEKAGIKVKLSFGDQELSNIVEGTGSGCLFFDYDNDGKLDIYIVNGRYRPDVNDNTGRRLKGKLTNYLYHNDGDGTFTDVTKKAGVTGGDAYGVACSAADYDGDGFVDLLVLNYGPNVLYHNNGDGTFTDVSKKSGLDAPGFWSLSGVWFDYNGDGKLDLFVATYLEYDGGKFRNFYPAAGYPGPLSYPGQADRLFRNNGDGTFTDVTQEAGVFNKEGRGMSATAADFLNSGKLDLYVANDAMESYFFRNLGGGKFSSDGLTMGLAFGEGGQGVSSMGPVFGDVDRDGKLDLYIPDMGYGCLHVNKGEFFEDQTNASGLALICGQYTGWGAILQDFDNDGWLDLFVANGDAHHEYGEGAVMAHNAGKGKFVDVANRSGPYFAQKFVGRGAAWGDFDNDGDIDILVINLGDSPRLLRNDGGNTLNHWLTIDARGPGGKTPAIGARISVKAGELSQVDDLVPVRGYLSQGDPRPHFGLGKAAQAERVEIRWPDGRTTVLTDVPANQILKVEQPSR